MEAMLLIIAGVVVYFLYNALQDYLKNPINQERFDTLAGRVQNLALKSEPIPQPYAQSLQDSIIHNEFGVLAAILGRVVWSDDKKCELEMRLLDELLEDMANEAKKSFITKAALEEIIEKQRDSALPLEELCEEYVKLTKGEYKKRLKVVEFLFALGYADGELSSGEQDCIIDIAAYFEIANDDFNALMTQFEAEYQKAINMDIAKACEIFGLKKDDKISEESLTQAYEKLIKDTQQNIFDNKNINKTFSNASLPQIRQIDAAYKILLDKALADSMKITNNDEKSKERKRRAKNEDSQEGWDF